MEARPVMGEVEVKSGMRTAGRSRQAALQRDATTKGFLLLAREAAAARQ
jgi:hypothetical protein